MKRSLFVVFSLLLILAIFSTVAGAEGPSVQSLPGSGWYTGHTVANTGAADATINVTAYDSASSNTYTFDNNSATVPSGGSTTWLPSDFSPALPDNFQGSAVVSSDQMIKGIVNVTNRSLGDLGVAGGEAAAQYRAVSNPDITVAFPIVKFEFPANNPGRKTTTLYLQNAGDDATTIEVEFQGTGCSPCTYTTPSLSPGQMVAVTPNDATGLSAGFLGSATATSTDNNIAGVFMETPYAQSPTTQAQAATGFSPNEFDNTILVPVYKYDFGSRSAGLQVQNVGDVNVDLTVTYVGDKGTCAGSTYIDTTAINIAPGSSVTFLEGRNFTAGHSGVGMSAGCLAAVSVVASSSSGTPLIAGTVSESFYPTVPSVQRSTIYSAFPAKLATTKVSLPVVKHEFGKKSTGVTCQNTTNTSATNVVYQYAVDSRSSTQGGQTLTSSPQTIPANGSISVVDHTSDVTWPGTTSLSTGTLNSLVVTSDQPIVCVANESPWGSGVSDFQDKNNYEGFNLIP